MDCLLLYLFDSTVALRFKWNENVAITRVAAAWPISYAIAHKGVADTIIGSKTNPSPPTHAHTYYISICYTNHGMDWLAEVMTAYAF